MKTLHKNTARKYWHENTARNNCTILEKIIFPNKSEMTITGNSSFLNLKFSKSDQILQVNDVTLVSEAGCNHISLGKLDTLGNEFKVGGGRITVLGTDLDFKLEDITYCA